MLRVSEQHVGKLVVDGEVEVIAQVTGLTHVLAGGVLVAKGQLAGGLIIEPGGRAIVHSQVARNVINKGCLELHGQVAGKVIGHLPQNPVRPEQIVGNDLKVPFKGRTYSWSSTSRFD